MAEPVILLHEQLSRGHRWIQLRLKQHERNLYLFSAHQAVGVSSAEPVNVMWVGNPDAKALDSFIWKLHNLSSGGALSQRYLRKLLRAGKLEEAAAAKTLSDSDIVAMEFLRLELDVAPVDHLLNSELKPINRCKVWARFDKSSTLTVGQSFDDIDENMGVYASVDLIKDNLKSFAELISGSQANPPPRLIVTIALQKLIDHFKPKSTPMEPFWKTL